MKPNYDLVDAKTGKVVADAGKKITARVANKLVEDGLVDILVPSEDLFDRFIAEDIVNPETGEIYVEAGDALTEAVLATLIEAGVDELPILDIDHAHGRPVHPQHAEARQEREPRAGAVRHLSRHASGRTADDRHRAKRCSTACSPMASATISPRSAA